MNILYNENNRHSLAISTNNDVGSKQGSCRKKNPLESKYHNLSERARIERLSYLKSLDSRYLILNIMIAEKRI